METHNLNYIQLYLRETLLKDRRKCLKDDKRVDTFCILIIKLTIDIESRTFINILTALKYPPLEKTDLGSVSVCLPRDQVKRVWICKFYRAFSWSLPWIADLLTPSSGLPNPLSVGAGTLSPKDLR